MNTATLNGATLDGVAFAAASFPPTFLTAAVVAAPGLIDPTLTVVTNA